jgi:hypothetical protein
VPKTGSEEIELYIRTYYSLLRSSDAVQIDALVETHMGMNSSLHILADETQPDISALIYASQRLPRCIVQTKLVVLGQTHDVYKQHGYPTIESWERVVSPGRRRHMVYDGVHTLAAYIASRSDIDDLIPILTAYQIEWNKIHTLLQAPPTRAMLDSLSQPATRFATVDLEPLAQALLVTPQEFTRLQLAWGEAFLSTLHAIAAQPKRFSLRLLAGSLINYQRATADWWHHVESGVPQVNMDERPVYFVSSNPHAMANLLTGFALREWDQLMEFVRSGASPELLDEYRRYVDSQDNDLVDDQNFAYFALRRYMAASDGSVAARRADDERACGISRVFPTQGFDIEAQVIEINRLVPEWIDPRLTHLLDVDALRESDAVIVNIDYPLGMAAYQVLTKIGEMVRSLNGIYVMGKAATLNSRIGDVMLPNVVHDEHSQNTYLFGNCFRASDLAHNLKAGTVLDNQKAITARGTFLQNPRYMDVFYREGYTIVEMEAGPYLSAVYEMVRPQRHPVNEIVNLYPATFDVGMIHYASDTPLSKGKNLGAGSLSYIGVEPTYAAAIAILRRIFQNEVNRVRETQPVQ